MIDLIERKTYPADEYITISFASTLKEAGIHVEFMDGPFVNLKTGDGDISISAKMNKFDDINYATRAIINAKPLVVFLYNVTKTYGENGASYIIRYNCILNDSLLKESIQNETN